MNTPPKEFIIFWCSAYAGKNRGSMTPAFKANMKSFENADQALEFEQKLFALKESGTSYQGRWVHAVGNNIELDL